MMLPVDDVDPAVRRVGRYSIYGEIASGGMATVHLGRLTGLAGFSKTVAIKRLHPHLAIEPDFVAMLMDEARLTSFIQHPNVVSSLDVVYEGDELLLVMDYVEGETLARLLSYSRKHEPLSSPGVSVITRVLTDVLAGLHAAHTAKTHNGQPLSIVHRDISPQNILVGVDGIARVLDFGVAKAELRRHVTMPGTIKGKLAYMSPEQVRGQPLDARTDVFAAGVVLWQALTRRRLFAGTDAGETCQLVLKAAVPPPSSLNPDLPPELDRVVLRALAPDRNHRYSSAAEFAEELAWIVEQANSIEVGRWVRSAAHPAISERSRLLHETQNGSSGGAPSNTRARLRLAPAVREPVSESRLPSSGTSVATVSLGKKIAARERRRSLLGVPLRLALGVPLLLALGVVAAVVVHGLRPSLPTTSEPASASVRKGEADATPGSLASAMVRPAAVPPVASNRSAASAGEGNEPSASAALVDKGNEPSAKPRLAASPPAKAPAALRTARAREAKPVPSEPVTQPAPAQAAPKTAMCNPPYRIDEFGIRRVRRECL